MIRRGLIAFTAALLTACAHAPEQTTASEPSLQLRASDFYPLAVGNRWIYEEGGGGRLRQRTIEIREEREGYFVDDAGGALRHDEHGLRDPDRYLLRSPVEKGVKWHAVLSLDVTEYYEVIEAGRSCSVPAGTFARCVRVRGSQRIDERRVLATEWTYAEGVGLVSIRTVVEAGDVAPVVQFAAQLLSFELAD